MRMRIRHRSQPKDHGAPLETRVPGRSPIRLRSHYPEFRDYYPLCELQTKRWIVENVRPDWICIDAGANIGYHSILMAQCACEGEVIAFEPTSTHNMLLENIRENCVLNVRVEKHALSDKSGFFVEPIYRIWGKDPEVRLTHFITIDDFMNQERIQQVDLIKIDVDGFDFEVLKGAVRTLNRYRPAVIVEINEALKTRGVSAAEIFQFMLAQKYEAVQILDLENYVFTSTWDLGMPWPRSLQMRLDCRDPLGPTPMVVQEALVDIRSPLTSQNLAKVSSIEGGFRILSEGPKWAYAACQRFCATGSGEIALEVCGQLLTGALGMLVTSIDGREQVSEEIVVRDIGQFRVLLPIRTEGEYLLVFRSVETKELEFEFRESQVVRTKAIEVAKELLSGWSSADLADVLGVEVGDNWNPLPLSRVSAITASDLSQSLGRLCNLLPCPGPTLDYDASDLVMERDDAPILQWIFQVLQPRNHLEFGTWEGFGALLCLRSTSARVWTINLPDGESNDTDFAYPGSREPYDLRNPAFLKPNLSSDQGTSIGWMYRANQSGERVTQLLIDSQDFQPAKNATFEGYDTVFIDGSHKREVVRSDQIKALDSLADSGIVIWHDFTLDPAVLSKQPACGGVIAAVADDLDILTNGGHLYWIEGTLLLLRVP